MVKRDELMRFGVAMEASLLTSFDALVEERDSTRSKLLRDLARGEVARAAIAVGADAVATVTIVYDHRVRDLTARLAELQHALGRKVRSSMHVSLDQVHSLDVIVLEGPGDELKHFADQVIATRGVKHGALDILAAGTKSKNGLHVHLHEHDHEGEHHHDHYEHGDDHHHDHHHHDGAHTHTHAPHPSTTKPSRTGSSSTKTRVKKSRKGPGR